MCGLDIAPVSYIGGAVGGGGATPDYSVALFADLPSGATAGQRVAVTGESGLSGVVCVNTALNTWEVESVTCTESAHAAITFGTTPGQWYNSGGITVGTANGAWLYDTTYADELRWIAANAAFVPAFVYAAGFSEFGKASGDATSLAALPAPYVVAGGGTATVTSVGGKIQLAVSTSSATSSNVQLYLGPTPTAAQMAYFRCLFQITAQSALGGSYSYSGIRVSISDASKSYDFGRTIINNALLSDGRWFNAANAGALITAQISGTIDLTAETLVEVIKGNGYAMARVGGSAGRWTAVASTDVRDDGAAQILIDAIVHTSTNAKTATCTVRNIVAGVLA